MRNNVSCGPKKSGGVRTFIVGIVRNGIGTSSTIVTVVEVSAGPITTNSDIDDD